VSYALAVLLGAAAVWLALLLTRRRPIDKHYRKALWVGDRFEYIGVHVASYKGEVYTSVAHLPKDGKSVPTWIALK
jgi:hypothetical protein